MYKLGPAINKSDHCVMEIFINLKINDSIPKDYKKNWPKADYAKIIEYFSSINWDPSPGSNVTNYWDFLKKEMLAAIENFVPSKISKASNCPWIDRPCSSALSRKRKLWNRFLHLKSTSAWIEYKKVRNET